MNALKSCNKDGELITLPQTCEESNLGMATVRRIAEEAGAVRRIGRCYRINRKLFFDFIEQNCSV